MRLQGTGSDVRRARHSTVRIATALAMLLGLAALALAAVTLHPNEDASAVAAISTPSSPPPTEGTTSTPSQQRSPAAQDECPRFDITEPAAESRHAYYFSRGIYHGYSPYWGRGGSRWDTDFEKADRQFLVLLRELIDIDAFPCENPVRLDDPELRRFPFLYMVEVGYLGLTEAEVEGLRSYLLAGGFLLVDDFWGNAEWANFEENIRRVLPEYPIREIPMEHPVFHVAYDIDEVLQVPSIYNAQSGVYYERYDATEPYVRGIFDDEGRLLVGIVFNSDLGDAWEWAEQPDYPWDRANFAIKMGVNFIVYAMTH